jgi:hypothetical protein
MVGSCKFLGAISYFVFRYIAHGMLYDSNLIGVGSLQHFKFGKKRAYEYIVAYLRLKHTDMTAHVSSNCTIIDGYRLEGL